MIHALIEAAEAKTQKKFNKNNAKIKLKNSLEVMKK